MTSEPDLFADLVNHGPTTAAVGGGLVTTVEAVSGQEIDYVRWYEDDHYISGALAWPWLFSGRRWIATRDLKPLRQPSEGSFVEPVSKGSFLHTYLITEGHIDDIELLAARSLDRLESENRMGRSVGRVHLYTHFQDYLGAAYAPGCTVRDIHAFDHPFNSVVLEVLDASETELRGQLVDWLIAEHAPTVLDRGPSMCLVFAPRPQRLTGDAVAVLKTLPPHNAARLTVLWLSAGEPAETYHAAFTDEQDTVRQAGHGTVRFLAPFRPAIPGTNTYLDQL